MDYEPTLSGALMRYLITSPTPLLERLGVTDGEARYPPGFRWVDAFSQKVAPRLRHLELRDFLLLWDSSLLSHLHSLHVYGDASSVGPTTSQMVQILKACPDLVHLVINCYMTGLEDETTIPIDFQPIELPDLKVFSLRLDPTGLQYILQVTHIPACARFYISGPLPTENIFSGDIDHHIPIFLPIIASANSIYIHLGAIELSYRACAAEDSSPHVLFSVQLKHQFSILEGSYWSTLTWMLDHIHPPSLSIPVALSIETPSLPLTQLFTQLWAYPVTSLSIMGNGIDEDNIIPYLTQPVMVDGTLRWRLPTLSELSFEWRYNVNASEILSIVEGRLGLAASVLGHRIQEPPLRLTKLRLPRQMGGENAAHTAAVRKLRALVDHVE
ncbi:hypothetical protein FRB98_001614 [Tulasnella sp. 332]|nr:hypothetical protein FRB98_001614 [Tulasnella sp. 332]